MRSNPNARMILSLVGAAVSLSIIALPAVSIGEPPESDWHQWRGPNRDNISPDTGLLKQWPAGGPPRVWKAAGLGKGYSSVSITGDRLFTMGESGGASNLIALNAADGKPAWTLPVGATGGSHGGGPRSTPIAQCDRRAIGPPD